jgi:putative FmdB family regulatory protein
MPLFEYRCNECHTIFEALIYKDTDELNLICPTDGCESTCFEKQISAPNFLSGQKKEPKQNSHHCASECEQPKIEIKQVPATIHHPEGDEKATVNQITLITPANKKKEFLN